MNAASVHHSPREELSKLRPTALEAAFFSMRQLPLQAPTMTVSRCPHLCSNHVTKTAWAQAVQQHPVSQPPPLPSVYKPPVRIVNCALLYKTRAILDGNLRLHRLVAGTGATGTTEQKQEAKDEHAGRIGMADDDTMTEATAAMAVVMTPPDERRRRRARNAKRHNERFKEKELKVCASPEAPRLRAWLHDLYTSLNSAANRPDDKALEWARIAQDFDIPDDGLKAVPP